MLFDVRGDNTRVFERVPWISIWLLVKPHANYCVNILKARWLRRAFAESYRLLRVILSQEFVAVLVWDAPDQRHKGLSSPFFPGTFWTDGRTNIAGISRFGEVARHPGLYGFRTCTLCHEVSHRELFANIPSLPFVLLTVFFQSSPRVMTTGEDRNKDRFKNWKLCVFRRLPFRYYRAVKVSQN